MAKNFIQNMHLKKGVFKKAAAAHGKSTHEYAEEEKHASGKVGKRARLALTFEHLRHKGKKRALAPSGGM